MDSILDLLKPIEIPVKSEICLAPNQCYEVTTYIPGWITLILIGSVFTIIKNF